jgi:nitrilase
MIFGPDGKPLCEPVGVGEEAILKADIDLRDIDYAKTVCFPTISLKAPIIWIRMQRLTRTSADTEQFIDTVGHYARPDLLSLLVNPTAAKHVTTMK